MLEHQWQQIIDGTARLMLEAERPASILMRDCWAPAAPRTEPGRTAMDEGGSNHA